MTCRAAQRRQRFGYPARLPDGRLQCCRSATRGQPAHAVASLVNHASLEVVDTLGAMLAPPGPGARAGDQAAHAGAHALGAGGRARALGHARYLPMGYSRKFWYDEALSAPVHSDLTRRRPRVQAHLSRPLHRAPMIEGRRLVPGRRARSAPAPRLLAAWELIESTGRRCGGLRGRGHVQSLPGSDELPGPSLARARVVSVFECRPAAEGGARRLSCCGTSASSSRGAREGEFQHHAARKACRATLATSALTPRACSCAAHSTTSHAAGARPAFGHQVRRPEAHHSVGRHQRRGGRQVVERSSAGCPPGRDAHSRAAGRPAARPCRCRRHAGPPASATCTAPPAGIEADQAGAMPGVQAPLDRLRVRRPH